MTLEQLKSAVREAEDALRAANAESADATAALVAAQGVVSEKASIAQACRDAGYRAGGALHRAQYRLNEAVSNEVAREYGGAMTRERLETLIAGEVRSKVPFASAILHVLEDRAWSTQGLEREDLVAIVVEYNGKMRTLTDAQKSRVMVGLEAWCPTHPDSGRYLPPYEVEWDNWSQ